jgi:hypothetical protein
VASVIVDMKHPRTTSNHSLWGRPATVSGLRQKTSSRQSSGTKGGCEPGNSISRFLCIKHYPASATSDVGACSGAECRKDLPPSGQGEIFFLDISFYRTPIKTVRYLLSSPKAGLDCRGFGLS